MSSSTGFTFVTSGGPRLEKQQDKLMRAHVTKRNFAERRKRHHEEHLLHAGRKDGDGPRNRSLQPKQGPIPSTTTGFSESESDRGSSSSQTLSPPYEGSPEDGDPEAIAYWTHHNSMAMQTHPPDPYLSINFLLLEFRPILFFDAPPNSDLSTNPETEWINLVLSEPALLEASLSVGLKRHRQYPHAETTGWAARLSHWHAARACKIINERLSAGVEALNVGVLGAVFTLAFGERVSQNEAAWDIHVNGLIHMIQKRTEMGLGGAPPWFSDLLLYDSLNANIGKNQTTYRRMIIALDNNQDPTALVPLFPALTMHIREWQMSRDDGLLQSLLLHATELDDQAFGPLSRALSLSVISFLHLSWLESPWTPDDFEETAREILELLGATKLRLCTAIDLTVWQVLLASAACRFGTDLRGEFNKRLRRLSWSLGAKTWEDMKAILKRCILPDDRVLERCRQVWLEVDEMEGYPIM